MRPHYLALPAVAVVLAAAGCGTVAEPPVAPLRAAPVSAPPVAVSAPVVPRVIRYPGHGGGRFVQAPGQTGKVAGRAGRLLTYRVLIEKDIRNLDPADFADTVQATLAAPQGWTSGGRWRFHRVGPGRRYDFTLYLATPGTRDVLCESDGDGYTSCRNGDKVVLNVARWVKGVPAFDGDLASYRAYMVNHEVGHRIGMGHMRCPVSGEPAPVMQQQTLGMHGCTPNPWPYPDGGDNLHVGPYGTYDDPQPPPDEGNE